jgi:hypothetical protein
MLARLWRVSDCEELVGAITAGDETEPALSLNVLSNYFKTHVRSYFSYNMSNQPPESMFPSRVPSYGQSLTHLTSL